MSKNCGVSVSKEQKIVLKVLNCLWTQFVSQRTGGLSAFMAKPSEDLYNVARDELNAIATILNNNPGVKALNTPGKAAYVLLIASFPDSTVAISTNHNLDTYNTYCPDFMIRATCPVADKEGVRKSIENLNNNECISQAYQIRPNTNSNLTELVSEAGPKWVAQASITERTGCPGIANTGFITLALEVDIEEYKFNSCENILFGCIKNKCKKH